jgi:hypothetical protein
MVTDKSRKRLPPYISYRTFRNFIDGLQQGLPARIDRSYWGERLSGSTGTQLMAALRFLGLVNANGIPSDRLKQLASAKGDTRAELLRETTTEAFGFLLLSSFDLETATYAQLQEIFHYTFQLTGDVSRKCIKFFIALASDAGIPLSPFITKRSRMVHATSGTKTVAKRTSIRTNRNLIVPQKLIEVPGQMSWGQMLLAKFPTFDPNWSDEVKLHWFEAFDKLLERGPKGAS